jgi:iron-sulfur cluster repair protein YtfE (RIC family)
MPIKRHKALQPLSRDHHQGLIIAQVLKKNAPAYRGLPSTLEGKKEYSISFYNSELVKHFKMEEEILFPLVNGKNSEVDKLIEQIINEHRQLKRLIIEIQETAELENKLDEFGRLLEKHIRIEERILFPKIEKTLTEVQLFELETKLK